MKEYFNQSKRPNCYHESTILLSGLRLSWFLFLLGLIFSATHMTPARAREISNLEQTSHSQKKKQSNHWLVRSSRVSSVSGVSLTGKPSFKLAKKTKRSEERKKNTFERLSDPMGTDTGLWNGSLAWEDIDSDGDKDLAVSGVDYEGNARLMVYKNNGSGNFTLFEEPMGSEGGIKNSSIAWADITGNNVPDLVVLGRDNEDRKRFMIYKNNGEGNLTLLDEPLGKNRGLDDGSLSCIDLDDDGAEEVAVTGRDSNRKPRFIVFQNGGNGNLSISHEPRGKNKGFIKTAMAWKDVNKDGNPELALSGISDQYNRRLQIWASNKQGELTQSQHLLGKDTGVQGNSVEWAEINGDGWPDLIVGGHTGNSQPRVMVFRNNGNGNLSLYSEPMEKNKELYSESIAAGDFNGDGADDLIVTGITRKKAVLRNTDDERFILFRNDGQGNFKKYDQPLGENEGYFNASVAWADANGDGQSDLAVIGSSSFYKQIRGARSTKIIEKELRFTIWKNVFNEDGN